MSRPVKVGDMVRLRTTVARYPVPQGRQNHKSAKVLAVMEYGALHLDRDLNGARWWNRADVQLIHPIRNRTCGSR